jgi:hypothetical protein
MTFVLFPKVKEILKGRHFDDNDDIRNNMMAALKVIPQNQFQNCSEGWTRPWVALYRDEFTNFIVSPRI